MHEHMKGKELSLERSLSVRLEQPSTSILLFECSALYKHYLAIWYLCEYMIAMSYMMGIYAETS